MLDVVFCTKIDCFDWTDIDARLVSVARLARSKDLESLAMLTSFAGKRRYVVDHSNRLTSVVTDVDVLLLKRCRGVENRH